MLPGYEMRLGNQLRLGCLRRPQGASEELSPPRKRVKRSRGWSGVRCGLARPRGPEFADRTRDAFLAGYRPSEWQAGCARTARTTADAYGQAVLACSPALVAFLGNATWPSRAWWLLLGAPATVVLTVTVGTTPSLVRLAGTYPPSRALGISTSRLRTSSSRHPRGDGCPSGRRGPSAGDGGLARARLSAVPRSMGCGASSGCAS